MCQYSIIFVHITQFFGYTHKKCAQKSMLYWHIENHASLLTNLFVKITISFLQC